MLVSLLAVVLSGIACILGLLIYLKKGNNNSLNLRLESLQQSMDRSAAATREDARTAREDAAAAAATTRTELSVALQQLRTELTTSLHNLVQQNATAMENLTRSVEERLVVLTNKFEDSAWRSREVVSNSLKENTAQQKAELQHFGAQQSAAAEKTVAVLQQIHAAVEQKLTALSESAKGDAHLMRQALEASFRGFNQNFSQSVEGLNNRQREGFAGLEEKQLRLIDATDKKLEGIRETVDEKLQKTLNERLGHSFSLVSQQLEHVQRGLGEMQTLAQDVGGLKKVLSNVKMRGGFGEVQLHMLLEHILAPEQYEANVATKKDSAERVEFAVKFPVKDGDQQFVWLPIDAKFPKDAYEHLQHAYEDGDAAQIEAAQKALDSVIRKMAKDICEKYLDVPGTTAFGIMFLPFEGLFAEVVRKASLLEEIQRSCNVVITGPTTLAVILNSLQMGFRTLAIQKRSSEVWQVLAEVKKEFGLFGGLLEKAQTNIQRGLNDLDAVVGVRTRAIQRKLKGVEVLNNDTIDWKDAEQLTEDR